MPVPDLLTLVAFALAIVVVTPFLGRYIARVMEGERVFLSPVVRPVERGIYRVGGIDETVEQGWKGYAVSVLAMAFVAIVVGYVVLRLAGRPAAQSRAAPADVAGSRLQHVGQLRDQHELAELLGRDRRHLPVADDDAGGPELHVGRDRPGHRDRAASAVSPAARRRPSGTTGST